MPPRSVTSPAGAILLSTATMLLAIAASTLLLSERELPEGPQLSQGPPRSMSFRSSSFDEPRLIVRPAMRCDATKRSMPLTPPVEPRVAE